MVGIVIVIVMVIVGTLRYCRIFLVDASWLWTISSYCEGGVG